MPSIKAVDDEKTETNDHIDDNKHANSNNTLETKSTTKNSLDSHSNLSRRRALHRNIDEKTPQNDPEEFLQQL